MKFLMLIYTAFILASCSDKQTEKDFNWCQFEVEKIKLSARNLELYELDEKRLLGMCMVSKGYTATNQNGCPENLLHCWQD